ncbi:transposase [Bacillus coagulans]|nr:transposase [Heyndrickxia coagulans]
MEIRLLKLVSPDFPAYLLFAVPPFAYMPARKLTQPEKMCPKWRRAVERKHKMKKPVFFAELLLVLSDMKGPGRLAENE